MRMASVKPRVGIVGDINKIYRSMLEPVGLCGWWSTTTDGTPKVEQVLDLNFTDVVTLSFRIVALEENTLIRLHCVSGPWPWHDSSLEFFFKQNAD